MAVLKDSPQSNATMAARTLKPESG